MNIEPTLPKQNLTVRLDRAVLEAIHRKASQLRVKPSTYAARLLEGLVLEEPQPGNAGQVSERSLALAEHTAHLVAQLYMLLFEGKDDQRRHLAARARQVLTRLERDDPPSTMSGGALGG